MDHEELKRQYIEDSKNYESPWELWEFQDVDGDWHTSTNKGPSWRENTKYRRKEPPFQPESFSGLNWRESADYIGKPMEFSDDGEDWQGPLVLSKIVCHQKYHFAAKRHNCTSYYIYIRTCPETFKDLHPTIHIIVNGKDYHLSKPERKAPEIGSFYYIFSPVSDCINPLRWNNTPWNKSQLQAKVIHRTKDRAQAWADFWNEIHK